MLRETSRHYILTYLGYLNISPFYTIGLTLETICLSLCRNFNPKKSDMYSTDVALFFIKQNKVASNEVHNPYNITKGWPNTRSVVR
jgi:hypothetical protein